jgi:hypothetical protein
LKSAKLRTEGVDEKCPIDDNGLRPSIFRREGRIAIVAAAVIVEPYRIRKSEKEMNVGELLKKNSLGSGMVL